MTSDIKFLTSKLGDQSHPLEKQDQSKGLYSITASFCPPALGKSPVAPACWHWCLTIIRSFQRMWNYFVPYPLSMTIKGQIPSAASSVKLKGSKLKSHKQKAFYIQHAYKEFTPTDCHRGHGCKKAYDIFKDNKISRVHSRKEKFRRHVSASSSYTIS